MAIFTIEKLVLYSKAPLFDELTNEIWRWNEIVAPPGTGCLPCRRAMGDRWELLNERWWEVGRVLQLCSSWRLLWLCSPWSNSGGGGRGSGWHSLTFSATNMCVSMGGDLRKVALCGWTAIGSHWEKLSRNKFLKGLLWFSRSGKKSRPAAQSSTQGPPPSGALCLLASCACTLRSHWSTCFLQKNAWLSYIFAYGDTVSSPLIRVLVFL